MTSSPHVKISEIPYYETTLQISDHPPIYPNVDIIPYKGVNNKILINLSCNIGEYTAQPIAFAGPESEKSLQIYANQTGKPVPDMWTDGGAATQKYVMEMAASPGITFRNDDMPSEFEVYRIEEKPEAWTEFVTDSTSVRRTISSDGYSAVSFIDKDLKPNKKYYYTFRSKDVHKHVSNPSPVYQVELVDFDGAVYLLVDVIEVRALEKKRKLKKHGKRYMHVMPALEHTILNEESSNLSSEKDAADEDVTPTLGIVEPALFNHANPRTKFKVRLTSKSTGKKIDFNLKFKVENVLTPAAQGLLENPMDDPNEST